MNRRRFWASEGYTWVVTLILLGLGLYSIWPKISFSRSADAQLSSILQNK